MGRTKLLLGQAQGDDFLDVQGRDGRGKGPTCPLGNMFKDPTGFEFGGDLEMKGVGMRTSSSVSQRWR